MAFKTATGESTLGVGLVAKGLGALVLAVLIRFFVKLYHVRTGVRRMSTDYDIPIMPHSFLFGHVVTIGKVMANLPRGASGLAIATFLALEYPEIFKHGVAYLDLWPFMAVNICVFHPDMMAQFTQDTSLPKAAFYQTEMHPLTGNHDLVSSEGHEWKTWRSIFNPGFSSKNLLALVPAFLEEIQVLRDRMAEVGRSGEVIQLEKFVQKATIDIISRAVMGIRLHCQSTPLEPFSMALQNQIYWLVYDNTPENIIKQLNPYRMFKTRYNNWIMHKYLAPHVERSITEFINTRGAVDGPKTINYLAVKSYVNEVQAMDETKGTLKVDPVFVERAISHLKLFFFAGNDTTASTLSFAYNMLFRNPHTLAATRAEHDEVLGSDPDEAMARMKADPQLLNKMPYTSAVIKETLRLYPAASTARAGRKGFFLTHPDTGKRYPTEDCIVVSSHFTEHRMEEFWPRASEFVPERWFAREGEPLHVRKNAFRPFELGPRNCIGQELAQIELRAILAMTVRDFDIETAYPKDAPVVLGEQAYQTMVKGEITGHVKDGFPIRVKIRKV